MNEHTGNNSGEHHQPVNGINDKQYWQQKFAGEITKSYFPYDGLAPELELGTQTFQFQDELNTRLLKLGNNSDIRLHIIFVAAVMILLNKYTGNQDLTLGIPIYKQTVAGEYLNTVLGIKNRLEPETTFKDLLLELRKTIAEAVEHQNYPLEKLWQSLNLPGTDSECPLFDTVVLLENIHDRNYIAKIKVNTVFCFRRNDNTIELSFEYNASRYHETTIQKIFGHFQRLLQQVLEDVNRPLREAEIISSAEKGVILNDFNHTGTEYPKDKTIYELFEEQVQKYPEKTAVAYSYETGGTETEVNSGNTSAPITNRFDTESLTYGMLNRCSNQLARILIDKGVKPDSLVAIMASRSLEIFIGIMAILKAGGAYVPIDPDYPASRIEFMLSDSKPIIILTQTHLQDRIKSGGAIIAMDTIDWESQNSSNLGRTSGADHLAYLIYTSGSTGAPKGVMIEHKGIANLRAFFAGSLGITADDRVIQFASFSFDASVWEMWMALLLGGTLYEVSKEILNNFQKFEDYLTQNEITVATLPPPYLVNLNPDRVPSLKKVIAAGSASPADLVNTWSGRLEFINAYGPTETTICASIWKATGSEPMASLVPIGKPITNTQIYIVDSNLKLQPIGIPGEICIAGPSLARGYFERPELTAEKFVPNPFVGGTDRAPQGRPLPSFSGNDSLFHTSNFKLQTSARLYKTGDLGRWLPDGNIEFLGRIDNQVKIRGFRIETGEIEYQLLKYPGMKEAFVGAEIDESGNGTLAAYFTASRELTASELNQFLISQLPDYMIPNYFVQVEKFPLTPSGKIDRKALPQPAQLGPKSDYLAPQNELQQKLKQVWQEVLGVAEIGIDTDFFALGGDSIKAIQISARLQDEGLKLEMKDLFGCRTIQEVSKAVKTKEFVIDQQPVTGEISLAPIQRWFFDRNFTDMHHFNQPALLYRKGGIDENIIRQLFTEIMIHHDTLRIIFKRRGNQITQAYRDITASDLFTLEVYRLDGSGDAAAEQITEISGRIQASLDLFSGPLVKLGLFHCNEGDYLLIVVHHLLIDTVSWQILFEDITTGYLQAIHGANFSFHQKTHSYKDWVGKLASYANSPELLSEIPYWKQIEQTAVKKLPKDKPGGNGRLEDSKTMELEFSAAETGQLLKEVNRAYHTEINDILLAALGLAVKEWTGEDQILIGLEAHGREELFKDLVIHRTIGWFTASFPVILHMEHSSDLPYLLKTVKEDLRHIPKKGIGYLILKYLTAPANQNQLRFGLDPEIAFNYLGQFDQEPASEQFTFSQVSTGSPMSPKLERWAGLEINGMVADGKLKLFFRYAKDEYHEETINQLIQGYRKHLLSIIRHCLEKDGSEQTPTDLGDKTLSLEELEDISELFSN